VPHLHGGIAYHIHLQSSHFQHFLSLLSLELPIYIKDMFPCTPIQIPFFSISESSHTFHIQSISSSDLWMKKNQEFYLLVHLWFLMPTGHLDVGCSHLLCGVPAVETLSSTYTGRERESFSWLLCCSEWLETPSSPKSEEGEHHIILLTSGHFRV